MSLSTQLARGHLALSFLLLFALLALATSWTVEAEPAKAKAVGVEINVPTCSVPPRHLLVLAQAPADLGKLANRIGPSCRA
jgi:hypothetical protein